MAKNIDFMGATFPDVPSIRLPQHEGGLVSFTDVTDTTAVASDVANGKYFYTADGEKTIGTASGGITPSGTIQITQNGQVDVTQYAIADVNVSGGGGSSYTLLAEKTITTSTTSTSASNFDTWETGETLIWTSDKWLYIRIRDTAGKRNGYFYGSDQWIMNPNPINQLTSTNWGGAVRNIIYVSDTGEVNVYATTGTTGYGVYTNRIYAYGRIVLSKRYNASYSLTVNGTYKVEVYLLDTPNGISPFA